MDSSDRKLDIPAPFPEFLSTIQGDSGALKYLPRDIGQGPDPDDPVLGWKEARRCQLAGHVVEHPRLGLPFVSNAAAEA